MRHSYSTATDLVLFWYLPPARVTYGKRAFQLAESLFPLPDLATDHFGLPVRHSLPTKSRVRKSYIPAPRKAWRINSKRLDMPASPKCD
jgi:hypothetical protein